MKKLVYIIGSMALTLGACSSCKPATEREKELYQMLVKARDSVYNQKRVIEAQAELIKRFDDYYHSTEELLDSLHVDMDTDLETDEGCQYLDDRYQLNQLFNELESNPKHRH
ncbi:MAG: hypothetical protein NC131_06120 [Roseburia sp.]|nr:hypothetical protein [Roseburia sp.]